MITPRFKLSQDDNYLFVTIHAPFSRVSDAEIYMDGTDFRFHSNPYYVRLNLPGEIIENDEAKAHFDADTNEFKITCPKVTKGTYFQGLDMLSSLLKPKGKRGVDSKDIEVLGETCTEDDSESDFDWFVEQKVETETDLPSSSSRYGFGLKHSGLFATLAEELHQVVDVKNPDNQSVAERRTERLEQEKSEFNPEHYLADFFQTDMIDPLVHYQLPSRVGEEWTEAETNLLKNFPNKDFLLDHDQLQSTYLGLVDILLAYCYDTRITMSDPTVESAWAIAKISGTLSWLENFTSIRQVVECFLRRSLCFPLFRSFKLSLKAIEDACCILKEGRTSVLRCFLQIYQLFNKSDPRYLLNQLYIHDYCVWIQKSNDETLASLSESLKSMELTKEDVNLNLVDLERAAINLMCNSDDSSEESDLEEQMARLTLKKKPVLSAIPTDLQVAAEAARMISSSESDFDSDDVSSSEESD
ncbi:hypothetical protein OUZ56_002905 [Daphnia magna]|uniref:Protein SHQ1 homolog n=1 Tax=Daphnia magna TaxID=35525 RepID=A0ABR0A7H0_9CRUS|nr:hypothetical protein OUZ56_002905 [Daphnia magna]